MHPKSAVNHQQTGISKLAGFTSVYKTPSCLKILMVVVRDNVSAFKETVPK